MDEKVIYTHTNPHVCLQYTGAYWPTVHFKKLNSPKLKVAAVP